MNPLYISNIWSDVSCKHANSTTTNSFYSLYYRKTRIIWLQRPKKLVTNITRWLLNTCLPTANPSPASLAVATCDRLTVVISISHVWNLLCKEDVHLHTPALQIGTHFLLTLETVVFLFHLLSTTSKPFSSLSTRFGVLLQKTCYINSLLLLLLPLSVSLLYYLHLLWSTLSSFFRNRFQNNNNNNNKTSIAP